MKITLIGNNLRNISSKIKVHHIEWLHNWFKHLLNHTFIKFYIFISANCLSQLLEFEMILFINLYCILRVYRV